MPAVNTTTLFNITELFDLKCLIKERDEEVAKLRATCQQQKSVIENHQSSTKRMNEVLCQQSSYTASLGCILSGLLWKASKESYTVQSIITGVCTLIVGQYF